MALDPHLFLKELSREMEKGRLLPLTSFSLGYQLCRQEPTLELTACAIPIRLSTLPGLWGPWESLGSVQGTVGLFEI